MSLLISTALFALGAIVASFVGVVAGRLNTGEGIVMGRSRCDACNTPLSAFSLVPILAYVVARGRAQCCGSRVSSMAPISEALLGTLFVLAYSALGFTTALPFMLIALAILLALVLYDLAHQILPARLLTIFVVFAALTGYAASPNLSVFLTTSVIAVMLSGTLAAIHFFSGGRAMGFSDAPLTFGLALLVGAAAFPGFVFSFWIGAAVGIAILARRPRGSRMGVEVPFAPFLAAGFLLAYFTQWNPFPFVTLFFGHP